MIKVGNLGVGGERGDVFSVDGRCPAESATQYKDPIKAIEVIGLNEYDDGTCRTIKNQYYKNSTQNFESTGSYGCSGVVETKRIEDVIIGGTQEHQAIKTDGVCTCLTSSMGTGGGYTPMIAEAQALRMVRTEEGKEHRKEYESGEYDMRFSEVKTEDVRTDGIANCVDTVQKDLRIVETKVPSIKIRQAVKNGFIECEVGGGMRFDLPIINNTQRKSARERTSESNTDNGEYP